MMHRKVAGKLLGHFVSCPTLSIWRPIPWAKVAHLGDMYWTYLGYILTTFWLLSGYTSCYTWATFRLHSGYILLIFRPILTIFWLHSDYMLTKFWLQSDYILTTFRLHSGYMANTILNFHFDYWIPSLILNFKILTKRSLRIRPRIIFITSTKDQQQLQPQNLAWELQNFDQTLCSKSGQKNDFMTKLQLPNLHQTIVNTFLSSTSATVATSTSFELGSSHNRVTSIKFTKQEWVS